MFVHFAKHITATATGRRIESVTCDRCNTHYFYELFRTGIGKASAPYFLFQDSAQRRADERAREDLAKRSNREAEMVPCPNCLWVNEDLIVRYRKSKYRRAHLLMFALMFVALVTGPILAAPLFTLLHIPEHDSLIPFLIFEIVWVVLPLSVLLI